MSNKNLHIETTNINESDNIPVDALVGLPPLQLNEIYNDDSFKLIERVPAKTVDVILEDMPYNTTACEWDVKIDLELYWETRLRILKPTGVVILTGSQPFTTDLINSNRNMFKYEWIWDKVQPSGQLTAKYRPMKIHENVCIFYLDNPIYNRQFTKRDQQDIRVNAIRNKNNQTNKVAYAHLNGVNNKYADDYDQTLVNPKTIIEFSKQPDRNAFLHPTQKPVGLFEYLIRTYSNEGDLVFDGFGGSGTTAIAAHKCKRNFIVIEKEKKYFDLAVRRLDIERAQYTML
jgi:site-specific DNA-methyltransferase (adenine-specific)